LLLHRVVSAFSLALLNAGSNSAARMAMMAITTSSSMSVNAPERELAGGCLPCTFLTSRIGAFIYLHDVVSAHLEV
jgi:hypothetical protein